MLKSLNLDGKKVLLLTGETQENVYKSGRNIPKVNVLEAYKASAYEILNSQVLLVQKGAVEKLEAILN
jgi:large subunit ribosomal protein L4